nr:hypothetical protein GCM10020185_86200 [Pseudomonas brassicacearum subsp. brassicacearum]
MSPVSLRRKNPEHIQAIQADGHEIACAGYRHQDYDTLDLAAQSDDIAKGCEALAGLTGQRPLGFRIPAGNGAPGFIETLKAQGIHWSSSWRGDDLPFAHPTAPQRH